MSTPSSSDPVPFQLRADLVAGFLVFLIALPLCLGIAMASGFPPVAGVLTAIVGGLLATFLGSAPLTIKGPAAGLIVIVLGAVQELGEGDPAKGYRRALAVGFVAAVLQIGFALVRAGRFGDAFPSSVVHGMLAAIGIIIISKQGHTVLGVGPEAKSPLGLLAELPHSLVSSNPEIALIGLGSLVILFAFPLLKHPWVRRIPSPLVVLLFAVPLGLYFDLEHDHTYSFRAHIYQIGPTYLVQLPGRLLDALAFPDFSVVTSGTSIKYVIMFALVGSIESLLSAKAVDALDPWKRQSNLDKDLLATGVANLVSACIGGLPMISEIVRSSANINSGARSRYANFFHGAFLLAFVALLPGLLHEIPLAALGAMLVYTGTRLASPREFRKTLEIGAEQLLIFCVTILGTLLEDLLVGVALGVLTKLVIHLVNGAPFGSLLRPRVQRQDHDDEIVIRVHGAAVFTNYLGIRQQLDEARALARPVRLDLSETTLVDHTVLERLHHLATDWREANLSLRIVGLEQHRGLSSHHLSARKKPAGQAVYGSEP